MATTKKAATKTAAPAADSFIVGHKAEGGEFIANPNYVEPAAPGKRFEGADAPVTVVAPVAAKGHTIPAPKKATKKAPAIVIPAGVSLMTERAGRFDFVTAATVPLVLPGWDKIEADTPDTSIGADAAVKYLTGIGADASRALVAKLFPKKLTVKKPRTVTARVARAKIDDAALLKFINDNGLASARIQAILDSVRAAGCSASQTRVDKLLGRVAAA